MKSSPSGSFRIRASNWAVAGTGSETERRCHSWASLIAGARSAQSSSGHVRGCGGATSAVGADGAGWGADSGLAALPPGSPGGDGDGAGWGADSGLAAVPGVAANGAAVGS